MTIAESLNGQPAVPLSSRCPVIREFTPINFCNLFTRENQHLTHAITIVCNYLTVVAR